MMPLGVHSWALRLFRNVCVLCSLALFLLLSVVGIPAPSGLDGKKLITREAYARWMNIQSPTLSNDGNWVAYTLTSPNGDGVLVVRSTRDSREWRTPRGTSDPHQLQRGG